MRSIIIACLFAFILPACGYNSVIEADENVKAAWADVQNQYKRRADLVPNLVSTVKGAANFEQETLTQVVEARAKATSMNVDAKTIDDPAKLKAFEQAQGQLQGALSRLMVVVEKYPELKATESFLQLQSQLEGTENRIGVARTRFIETVAQYNQIVLKFPTSLGSKLRGKTERATFEGTPQDANVPAVQF